MIVMRRQVAVDGSVRTDLNFPTGFMDVITIEKTKDNFRVLYDTKGRFVLQPIDEKDEERLFKLCRVNKISVGNKASVGRNPFSSGQLAAVPYVVTHDGRTIRYIDPIVKVNDTVKVDLATGKVTAVYKFEVGNVAMVTAGANTGRIGEVTRVEKHPGSHEIVHLKDKRGAAFATRVGNVFILGGPTPDGVRPAISVPKGKGIQLSILEERENRAKKAAKERE